MSHEEQWKIKQQSEKRLRRKTCRRLGQLSKWEQWPQRRESFRDLRFSSENEAKVFSLKSIPWSKTVQEWLSWGLEGGNVK